MRAKLVNENIKHLSPKELDKKDLLSTNWERAKEVLDEIKRNNWKSKFASEEDENNLKIIINTLTDLELIVDLRFSPLDFYIFQLEHLGKYNKKIGAFYIPISYGVNDPGVEIHVGPLTNKHFLHSTMDMQKVKDFINLFK